MSVSRRFFLQHAGLPVLACVSGGRLLGESSKTINAFLDLNPV